MSPTMSPANQLKLISRAWGRQTGFVFFPWIRGDAADKAQRIRGYNEGIAYAWPKDEAKILAHITSHTQDDLYWCPSIFEKPSRRLELAMDEHALWADLDGVDPREIEEQYKPSMAWETSPGRYQAVWLITGGDIQGASWPGNENQRLSYYLGADPSGWDTTQLLRIPGWGNHKPEYRDEAGNGPQGKLLWHNGRKYLPDDFEELPEIKGAVGSVETDALEEAIDAVDRLQVWGNIRLKVSKEVRELVAARDTGGEDRSNKLWQIERDLADSGLTVPEIVAIVRETVWNKFAGRNDEIRRLVTEASKAVADRSVETVKALEQVRQDKPSVANIFDLVKNTPPPEWLVKGILTKASCGFFAGEPKSFKSWAALDLAISVATNTPFLSAFDIVEPGPVLYIQEEDPLPTLKGRLQKLQRKNSDKVSLVDGLLVWEPSDENHDVPPIAAIVREQFTISDPGWQAWLDEVLADGYGGTPEVRQAIETEEGLEGDASKTELISSRIQGLPFKLIILDPLMMIAGEVDENRAQEMTERIFKPLKQLAEKHQVAIIMVHHMAKTREGDNRRGGQKMLGSVANHAWSECSLYFTHGKLGTMIVETESKFESSKRFEVTNLRKKINNVLVWEPEVNILDAADDDDSPGITRGRRNPSTRQRASRSTSSSSGSVRIGQGTRRKLARHVGLDENATQSQIRQAWEATGQVWGEWGDLIQPYGPRDSSVEDLDMDDAPRKPGRKPDADPVAFKVLRKLTDRQPRPYSTNEIRDEMASMLNQKPTQTVYLRAYQQLKKLYDTDKIAREGKDWMLLEVTQADLLDREIETLI